jgi:hypothetical protein
VPEIRIMALLRAVVREVLEELHGDFARLYSSAGRPSIPPEKLLSALLLQVFYGIRFRAPVDGAARLQPALSLALRLPAGQALRMNSSGWTLTLRCGFRPPSPKTASGFSKATFSSVS